MFPQSILEALVYEEREQQWNRVLASGGSCLFVAEVAGAVVGFACGGRNRDRHYEHTYPGELQAIYLLKAHQRLGIGRALFENVRAWLGSNGLAAFLLWVVAENPSCAFYERLGGTRIVTQPTEIRGARVIESAYGWR